MPQEVLRQSNFNGGELSPWAIGRRELKAYVSSLALCVNHIPRAEGPIVRRPGLAHVDRIRNKLDLVPLDGVTVTAPNGGTAEAILDGSGFVTTAGMETTDPYVIAEFDFGVPVEIGVIDLINYALAPAGYVPPVGGGDGGTGGEGEVGGPAPPQYPWGDGGIYAIP